MKDKPMTSLSLASDAPTFGQLLLHVMQLKGMNQQLLSHRADVSPSYVSKLISDQRDLTPGLAGKLSDVMGGTPEGWMAAFRETRSGAGRPLARQIADLLRGQALGVGIDERFLGTPVRQLREEALLRVFGNGSDLGGGADNAPESCAIDPFEPGRVRTTSYDTSAGSIGIKRNSDGSWFGEPATDPIVLGPHEVKVIGTREHITLPSWIEAELHEASNISLKPLFVSHGPVIDPGWSGRLFVTVFNPTDRKIEISLEEPFLTLRFWVAETEATIVRE